MRKITFTRNSNELISNGVSRSIFLHAVLKKVILLLLVSLYLHSTGFSQSIRNEDKLDPAFRYLIAAQKSASSKSTPQHFKVKPTPGFAAGKAVPEERYECKVFTKNAKALYDSGIVLHSAFPTFSTTWVTLDQIAQMASMKDVTFIEAPENLHFLNDISVGASGASLLHQGRLNNTAYTGKNVIVGVFDSGIDWKHLDFRSAVDTTKSRILRIWDQTITAVAGETPPSGFSYGVEYTQAQINNEIDGTPANVVREKDIEGHGTHVTGTAAGNGQALASKKYMGIAPDADLIIIKGGDSTFSDTRMIDAITYLKNLGTALGEPVVLNLSIGGLFGPHDGTRPNEVAIDNFTASAAGRAVVVAAGNDNGSNKHNRLSLAGSGTGSVSFTVPADVSGSSLFSYRIYTNSSSAISATFTAPGGNSVTAGAGQSTSGNVLSNAFTVYITNGIDASNNNRYVDLDVERNGSNTTSPAGSWTLSLTNNTSTALTLDGWLYTVDKSFATPASIVNGDNNYLVSSPGNAASAVTVGSYVGRTTWYTAYGLGYSYTAERQDSISSFSSHGPRRDNVQKPDISSDGQAVISCLSSNIISVDSSILIEKGLYIIEQGTSMATPGVTGSTALLLQANSGASASQLKSLLTSNAVKDSMTELITATPNAIWGYGKLDVFKAASALFNCTPTDRKTYKYDVSTRASEETGYGLTTERLAVRFTPDISGKLGGFYYQSAGVVTNLVVEVRTNNGGVPGTLSGTLNIPQNLLQAFSLNYIDLSSLNISTVSGTDYFIVLYRDPSSTAQWTIRAEKLTVTGHSLFSTNSGAAWLFLSADFKIRSEVYTNGQLAGHIATINSSDTRNINSSNQFINTNCELIDQLVPSGASAVSGTVNSKVWLGTSVPTYNGSPYVSRHYQITPAASSSTSTGRVTLYFTQAEFTAFNADPGSTLNLPANATDSAGKANLRIGVFMGTSSDSSGTPGSYSSTAVVIDPADGDIVYNTESSRWEVSFAVTGFGGFIVQTSTTTLPVIVEYFKGSNQGAVNLLTWKVNCTNESVTFDIERSDNGNTFTSIGTAFGSSANCSNPFSFTDKLPLEGKNYYRIKITESTGAIYYTNTILLITDKVLTSTINPTFIYKGSNVQVNFAGIKGDLFIHDAAGRLIYTHSLTSGVQSLNLPMQVSGVYFYSIKNQDGNVTSGKLVVE